MTIEFSKSISIYELFAIGLAVLSLLVQFWKWIFNKYIVKTKLNFIPSAMITLYFNKSGSYVSLGGVFEAKRKSAIVKDLSVKIHRQSDNAELSLTWSTFPSPVYRRVAGNYESSFETAHPFKVSADSLEPIFVEFANDENVDKRIQDVINSTSSICSAILSQPNITLPEADSAFKISNEFQNARISLNDDFFWKQDDYVLELTAIYNEDKVCSSQYCFSLSLDESNLLRDNITRLLIQPIGNHFNMTVSVNSVRKNYIQYRASSEQK